MDSSIIKKIFYFIFNQKNIIIDKKNSAKGEYDTTKINSILQIKKWRPRLDSNQRPSD